MKKLLAFFMLLLAFQVTKAQTTALAGNWLLSDVQITLQGNDETALTTENFIWRDVYRDKLPVKFTRDGQLIFQKDEKLTVSTYEVEGNEIYFYFTNERGAVSSTRYHIQRRGTELLLSREDPLVNERYLFKYN